MINYQHFNVEWLHLLTNLITNVHQVFMNYKFIQDFQGEVWMKHLQVVVHNIINDFINFIRKYKWILFSTPIPRSFITNMILKNLFAFLVGQSQYIYPAKAFETDEYQFVGSMCAVCSCFHNVQIAILLYLTPSPSASYSLSNSMNKADEKKRWKYMTVLI